MPKIAVENGPIATWIGRCVKCRKAYRWDIPPEYQTSNPNVYPQAYFPGVDLGMPWCDCRAAVTFVKFKPLNVKLVESKRCGRQCEHAVSAYCACSCGGRNHGRGHALDRDGVI